MERLDSSDRDYVASLARGLSVIRAFTRDRPRMTLSEVAQHAGMNRASARRFLITLIREGYADTDGRYFYLRPKILELGFSALSSLSLSEVAQPVMEDLSASLGETCLAAMAVPSERLDAVAAQVNAHPEVAHNYERTHALNMWFVLSAESSARITEVIAEIERETGLQVYPMPKLHEFFVWFRVEV